MGVSSDWDSTLAQQMATWVSEQILAGFDIHFGLDNTRESSRIARLLHH
ncbi:hypothetical protein ACFL3F_00995 [Planctomycetota bacterium]